MDEEDEHSPSEFYYPEDLGTFDVETEHHRVPYNKQLTNRSCSGRTGEYWPSVVAVRTSSSLGLYCHDLGPTFPSTALALG